MIIETEPLNSSDPRLGCFLKCERWELGGYVTMQSMISIHNSIFLIVFIYLFFAHFLRFFFFGFWSDTSLCYARKP